MDAPELTIPPGRFERLFAADVAAIRSKAALVDLEVRSELRQGMRNTREVHRCPLDFELRFVPNGTGGSDLLFTGFASVTCADHDDDSYAYEMEDWLGPWVESVVSGAFRKTLAEGADVAFLTNHGGLTMARTKSGTLKLSEVSTAAPTGLFAEARLDPRRPDVQMLHSAVEREDVDEMSFAFRVTRQEWNDDYDRRWITEVNLNQGDVSAVNYGANPHTGGTTAIRSAGEPDVRSYLAALVEVREGKTLSAATLGVLNGAIDRLGSAEAHTEAREMLAQLVSDVDPAQTGAAGNTETESAAPRVDARLAEAALMVARNREAEKSRKAA